MEKILCNHFFGIAFPLPFVIRLGKSFGCVDSYIFRDPHSLVLNGKYNKLPEGP
jgi:hypothetical protein